MLLFWLILALNEANNLWELKRVFFRKKLIKRDKCFIFIFEENCAVFKSFNLTWFGNNKKRRI